MVQGVNFNSNYPYGYQNAAKTSVNYISGNAVESATGSVFSGVGIAALLDGAFSFAKVAKTAKKEGKTVKSLFPDYVSAMKDSKIDISKKVLTNKDTYKNLAEKVIKTAEISTAEKCLPKTEKLAKMSKESQAAYNRASRCINKAKTAVKYESQKAYMTVAERYLSQAKALSTKNPLSKTVNNFATKSPFLAKNLKFVKGSGASIVGIIEGGLEFITQVIPTFMQLGPTKGIKQLFKSGIKVAGSVGGWAAGSALGAAVGSIIPGAGTAIGAVIGGVIGTVCGIIGSSVGSKIASKIAGKSELEKEQEKLAVQQQQQQAQNEQVQNIVQPSILAQAQNNAATSFSSNPFASADWMDKDIMALTNGYAR